MVFDFDDFSEHNHKLERLHELRELRGDFRCTVFAVPGLGSPEFWRSVPEWVELAVHGWLHPDPYECSRWNRGRMEKLLDEPIVREFFVQGFKAPGWQISDGCYAVLRDRGWWVADQHLEDARRPVDLRTYFYEDGHWHGHIQNVCGNGIEETWHQLRQAVLNAPSFEYASQHAH